MKILPPLLRRRLHGFTLVEMMVSVTIIGFVMIGVVAFMHEGVKLYYADRARLLINRDMRSFTSKIDTDAVDANYFCLYPSFSSHTDPSLDDGQVGDMLVLVYTDPSQSSYGVSMITRLVGYYREVTNTTNNTGPVHRFDIDLSGSNAVNATSQTMSALLTSKVTGGISSYPIVTQLAQGLATVTGNNTSVTPALFYNFHNRSVMVNAQISESLNEQQGSLSRTGNTYNFSISPRG